MYVLLDYPMAKAAECPLDPAPGLRTERRLMRVRIWDGSTPWLATRHEDQRALLRDPRVSADAGHPGYPAAAPVLLRSRRFSFFLMDDPEHARLRRMVTAPFAIKRVEAIRPTAQRIVDDLIDEMLAGPKPADLVAALALPMPSLVICKLLGVPYEDHEFFQSNSRTLVTESAPDEQRAQAHDDLIAYLDELCGKKIAHPGDDLMSALAARVEAGELTRDEAAQAGALMLSAGHETTANMIALGTLALLQHPDQFALLREADDPDLVASAVEELLRYLNITHTALRRVALEDIEIAGEVIRAGEGIVIPNDIANRDPAVFDEPDRLDIRRGNRRHVAFGFGVHQCLGQPLARMELQVAYGTLYRRIPTLALAAGPEEIPFKYDGIVFGVYELPVTW